MLLETVTAGALVAHLIGDYVLQSDWMANEKTKKLHVAFIHALVYSLPFLALSPSWAALAVIVGTHALIDRYRLAKYVVYAKNFLAPRISQGEVKVTKTGEKGEVLETETLYSRWWHPWSECTETGYHKDRPAWMAVWLLIIADNTLHILINAAALAYL